MRQESHSHAVDLEQPRSGGKKRRRSLRRALTIDCHLEGDGWQESVVLQASDVSDEGLWIDTPYALDPGEELVVSFALPGDPGAERIWAIAEVARVGMWRRRRDAYPAGMGLVFTYCSQEDLNRLSNALYGRPPRLPAWVVERSVAPRSVSERVPAERDVDAEPARSSAGREDTEAATLPAVLDWTLAGDVRE